MYYNERKINQILYNKIHGAYYGILAVIISVISVASSVILYINQIGEFSFATHFLSTIGDTPYWPALVFNSGMVVVNVIKIPFAFFLAQYFLVAGAHHRVTWSFFIVGLISSGGWLSMTLFPPSVSLGLHIGGAFIYFFGVIISQTIIAMIELRTPKIRKHLALSGIIVLIFYSIFFVFLLQLEMNPGLDTTYACITEWISYLAMLSWVLVHAKYIYSHPVREI